MKVDEKRLQDYGSVLAESLQRFLRACINLTYFLFKYICLYKCTNSFIVNSNAIDLESLCIVSGKYCWIVHIDILVLQLDGSLLDAASLAAYVALSCTKVPKVIPIAGESGMLDVRSCHFQHLYVLCSTMF